MKIFDNENIFPLDGESEKKWKHLKFTKYQKIPQNTDQSTSIPNDDCYCNNQKHQKVKDFAE